MNALRICKGKPHELRIYCIIAFFIFLLSNLHCLETGAASRYKVYFKCVMQLLLQIALEEVLKDEKSSPFLNRHACYGYNGEKNQ